MKEKIPYNCYIDKKGYILPKSPVIKATSDIIECLSTDEAVRFLFNDKPNTKTFNNEPWIEIGIGHSFVGNIYASTWFASKEEFNKYLIDNPYMKIFDEDEEAFMKYMRWVAKLGPWFTKQRFKKKD